MKRSGRRRKCLTISFIVQSDINVIQQEAQMKKDRIKENNEKIKLNKLPYLVANIVEVLDLLPEEDEEDGAR